MEQPDLDPDEHVVALRGLARVNWISGSSRIVWGPLRRLAREVGRQPLRVIDVACGGGDVLVDLANKARRANLPMHLTGCDVSATAINYARQRAQTLDFLHCDFLAAPVTTCYDVAMCSLFLHHMDENQAPRLLERLKETATRLVLVNDLLRGRAPYAVAYAGTRVLTRSRIVHFDGPASVAAAFTIPEVNALAARCGMHGARVSWKWPFRFLLEWRKT
jgi:SAM-dependent methyltransferase